MNGAFDSFQSLPWHGAVQVAGIYKGNHCNEMRPTHAMLYAFRLSLNQGATPALYRKNIMDRSTTTSAILLATVGLSLSMFSLKQMQSSPAHQRRLRRLY